MSLVKMMGMVIATALLLSACVSSQDQDIVAEGGNHPECANAFGTVGSDGALKDNFGGERPCF